MLKKSLLLLMLLCGVISIAPAGAEMQELNNHELQDLLDNKVTIIDLRRADEWQQTGIIEGSHLLTFFDLKGRYDAEKWMTGLTAVTDSKSPIILICHSGVRSRVVGTWLTVQHGFSRIYNVTDGIDHWKRRGNPVVAIGK